jgi:hypothetical protein
MATKSKSCIYCGRSTENKIALLLQKLSGNARKLLGGVNVYVCRSCYSEKEDVLRKDANKSKIKGSILMGIIMFLCIGVWIGDPENLWIAIGGTVGAASVAYGFFASAKQKNSIILLHNNSIEKYLALFGVRVPSKKFERKDVIFDYDLLCEIIEKNEKISHENISREIPDSVHHSREFSTFDTLTTDINENVKRVAQGLMKGNYPSE